jgi:hypothetical protein
MLHVPLAEVAPRLAEPVDVPGVLTGAAERLDVGRRDHLVAHLQTFVSGLRRARKLGTLARREIARGHTGPRLERIERALATTLKPLAFASLLAHREVERADDVARRPASEGAYLAASTALMTTLDRVIDQLEPALTRALGRLAPGPNTEGRDHHGRAA